MPGFERQLLQMTGYLLMPYRRSCVGQCPSSTINSSRAYCAAAAALLAAATACCLLLARCTRSPSLRCSTTHVGSGARRIASDYAPSRRTLHCRPYARGFSARRPCIWGGGGIDCSAHETATHGVTLPDCSLSGATLLLEAGPCPEEPAAVSNHERAIVAPSIMNAQNRT